MTATPSWGLTAIGLTSALALAACSSPRQEQTQLTPAASPSATPKAPTTVLEGTEFLFLKGTKHTLPNGKVYVCSMPDRFGEYMSVKEGTTSGFAFQDERTIVMGATSLEGEAGKEQAVESRLEINQPTKTGWLYNLFAHTKTRIPPSYLPSIDDVMKQVFGQCALLKADPNGVETPIVVPFMESARAAKRKVRSAFRKDR